MKGEKREIEKKNNSEINHVGIIPILGCEFAFFDADDLAFVAFRAVLAEFARVALPPLPLDLTRDPEEALRRELGPAPLAFRRNVRFVDPDLA